VSAERVKAHAMARLASLTDYLQLSGDQQREIFPILARSAPDFDSSMILGGGIAGKQARVVSHDDADKALLQTREDESSAILRELNPDQQALYEELLIDDGLWWADILAQIETSLYEATVRSVGQPSVVDDPGADENLFDLLEH
jgi:hypothetical protein